MEQSEKQFASYIPEHIKAGLNKAKASTQDNSAQSVELAQDDAQTPDENTSSTQPENLTAREADSVPEETPVEQTATASSENDEAKAWKGRLKKEQQANLELKAKWVEEAEKRKQAEIELAQFRQAQITAQQKGQTEQPATLLDSELEELRILNPELYLQIQQRKQQKTEEKPKELPAQQPQPVSPAPPTMSERDQIWYAEIQEKIPTLQGLLTNDPHFIEFALNKKDWFGQSALSLIQKAGAEKDVRHIDTIRTLIDEYEQSKTPMPTTITVAPQKNATVKVKAKQPKHMTEKDEAHAEMLVRKGKTKELKLFLAQFKK